MDAPNLHLMSHFKINPILSDFIGSKKAKINQDTCTGCQKCLESCRFHAIDAMDGKCQINEYACEGCGVCELVCPVQAVSMEDDVAGKQQLYISDCVFSTAKLKMGRGNSGKLVSEVKKSLFANAQAELAIIDGSPGIGCPVIASISGVDLILIVAEPSMSGLSDLTRLYHTARTLHVQMAVCVNKYDVSIENTQRIVQFCEENHIPFVGKIPYDKNALKAMETKTSLARMNTLASEPIRTIFDHTLALLGEGKNIK